MGKPLNLKTLLEFMDSFEEEGEWLWTDTLMRSYFSDRKDALYKKLKRFIDAGLIVRVARGVYANPRSRHRHPFTQLYDVANALRDREFFYHSLESRASELSLISQVPNRLTFITEGRSHVCKTPFGIVEFVHGKIDREKVKEYLRKGWLSWNNKKKVYEASPELVERDMRRHRRSVDLLEEQKLKEQMIYY
ncbi:hypothetical protein [Hydrogenivirga sp. 128-5-R1-1]|uniref:hypothetical protein n=1 Tax=Hydrogenivirga sp. 128-5-R1-1 TaxID=392423 RepID=UPI00015EF145|nr:hypothetical protein [Hydrogenivirga sp. 128-5-R1-1]EDP74655.1 hypothetical protein HG1285_14624 [Hydrogenivirga sp. 128-5-R1-1]